MIEYMKIDHTKIKAMQRGAGTPVVFLHGFLGNWKNLKSLAETLDPNHYSIYLLDMPSHGESASLSSLTYPKLTEALNEFFEEVGISEAILVGHSMGGKTAMSFSLYYPKKVLGLMALDISLGDHVSKQQQLLRAIGELNLSWTLKKARTYLEECLEDDRALVSFILLNLKSTPSGFVWIKDIKGLLEENIGIWEPVEIPNPCYPFENPFVSICGENSYFCSATDYGKMLSCFPKAQFINLENAGHFPHLENPSLCARHLIDLARRSKIYPFHLHFL